MRLGWYISGAGHAGLILFVLFGTLFSFEERTEVNVSEVSVISEAEFAALTPPASAPDIATDVPEVTPPEAEAAPEAPSEDVAPEVSAPAPVEVPESPDEPVTDVPEPLPPAVLVDEAPSIPLPETEIDGTAPTPDAVAAPAPRVAPVPQVETPQIEVAPEVVEDTAPAPEAPPEEVVVEEETPAAPEAASDRTVTEAEEVENYAPASSQRPRTRPARPVQVAEEPEAERETPVAEADPEPENDPVADAVAAAVAEANEPQQSAPTGPPLTGGEREAFRVAVGGCWNVGSLSTAALATTVGLAVDMSEDGRPDTGSIRMISFSGGSESAARQAFEAARRAVIRCGARGYPLPVEKYAQWREIEMTFNPEGMQFR